MSIPSNNTIDKFKVGDIIYWKKSDGTIGSYARIGAIENGRELRGIFHVDIKDIDTVPYSRSIDGWIAASDAYLFRRSLREAIE